MRAFLYVLTGMLWIAGLGLYIGSVEYPQDAALFIVQISQWLEPRIGIAINTTPEHIAGGLVVITSALFPLLRGFAKKSPKKNNETSLLSEIEKNVAKVSQDLDNAEQSINDASQKLTEQVVIAEAKAAELQHSRQRLAVLRNRCAALQTPANCHCDPPAGGEAISSRLPRFPAVRDHNDENEASRQPVTMTSEGEILEQCENNAALTRSWREEDGVIYFSVISDGTTGEDWIKRLEGNGFHVGDYAKQVLRSPKFKPTNGVTTEVAVLKGMLFADNDRITKKIRAEADRRKFSKPNAELACLIREKFTDKEIKAMGLWYVVAMHEPINDSDGGPDLLDASCSGGGRWLYACSDGPGSGWGHDDGFAFAVSPQ